MADSATSQGTTPLAPSRPHRQPQEDSTSRAMRVLGLASLALTLTTETIPFAIQFHDADHSADPGLALLVGSQVLAAVALLLRRHTRATAWALLTMLAVGIAIFMGHTTHPQAADLLLPGYWAFPLVAISMRTKQRREYGLFALVAMVSMLLVQGFYVGASSWEDLADLLWIVQPIMVVLLFGDAVISIDRSRIEALRRSEDARELRDEVEDRTAARRESERILNEHILTALRQIDRPGSARRATEACRGAWQTVEVANSQRRTTSVEQELRASSLLRSPGISVEGSTKPVPLAMARTMTAAAEAAIPQKDRLAGAGSVRIKVSEDGDQRTVVIDAPRTWHRAGNGVDGQDEVYQQMDAIGGQAEVEQGSRRTITTLRWPRQEQGAQARAWRVAPTQAVRSKLTRTAWPGLATCLLMTLLANQQGTRPAFGIALGVTATAVGLWVAMVLRRRALTRPERILLLLLATALWGANLALVPQAPNLDYPLWLAWGASTLVHLVVLSERVRVGAVITVVWAFIEIAGLGIAYQSWDAMWWHSFLVVTGAGDVLITLLVLWVARTSAAEEAEASESASRLRAATTQAQVAARAHELWSETVTRKALPLLEKVASGDVDPEDPELRTRARSILAELDAERPGNLVA